ncbi:HET-domain-containing protein [Mytilinidion resinicola]|uniref:HET-domain-containing protein n=1 Tax=Mytilinidion resinicola TaxID=574789 RepID=A0A6A6YV37_9PEZI|nr:HET-domain-containing protein [Mytilinidion resinicola]KAF2812630.1 HET-domain-containing protein [Mytilinidion resinicola]
MNGGRAVHRILEHGRGCALVDSQGIDECNCYISVNAEDLGPTRLLFQPVTSDGIPGVLGQLDETANAAIRQYIASKKAGSVDRERERHSNSVYSCLDQSEIRILELHPGTFESDLHGALHVASIDFEYGQVDNFTRLTNHAISLVHEKPIWYTALSYVWGAPIFDVPIYFTNGFVIKISRSLESAMRHLRAEKQSVWLWIDQICINQADTTEKEHQIPLMRLIYSHASNTVVWLGDDGEDSPSIAFETLMTLHSSLQFNDNQFGPEDFERLYLPHSEAQAWREVKQLFRRPWFGRLWVIQELLLSSEVYVKCGKVEASWEDFAAWCIDLNISGVQRWLEADTENDTTAADDDLPQLPSLGGKIAYELWLQRHQLQAFQSLPPLLSTLVTSRYAQATEPKDKIYGILGIAFSEADYSNFTLSYSSDVTVREVYLEASLRTFPNSSILRLLTSVDHEVLLTPSWVPDWSVPRVTDSFGYSTSSWSVYSAGGEYASARNPETGKWKGITYRLSDDKKAVTFPGKVFDSIVTLGCVTTQPVLDIDNPAQGNSQWTTYVDIAKASQSYPTETTIFDAFWQTLVAGADGSGHKKPPPEYSDAFSLILDESTGNMPSLPGQVYSVRRQKGHFTLKSLRSRNPQRTLEDLRKSFRRALRNRRFAVTSGGYFGLVPRGTMVRDKICVFELGHVPFVVRPVEDREDFQLVGECYVHGIMHGEVMERGDIEIGPVTLV